jgi:hypothetical protein
MNLIDYLLRAPEQPPEINGGALAHEAIRSELLGIAHQTGGPGQHTSRNTTIVRTCSPHTPTFDEGNGRPKLTASQRRCHPRWTSTDDDQIVHNLSP